MAALIPALRFLGLVAAPRPRTPPRRVRVRARTTRDAHGARRTIVDAELLLEPGDAVPATTPSTRRPSRQSSRHAPPRRAGRHARRQTPARRRQTPARRRRVRPLVALGLASRPIHLTGHPRIRERAIAGLRRRQHREKVVTASIGALLGIVLLGWGAVRSPLMAVEEVTVHGVPTEVSAQVVEVAGVRPGQNVLDVDLAQVEARLDALPWVAGATVRRQLPSTVEIRVSTRQAVLLGDFAGATYLIDADGLVIGQSMDADDRRGLAPITLASAPVIGRVIDADTVLAAAAVAAAMPPGMGEWVVGYQATAADAVDVSLRIPTETGPVELIAHIGRPVDVEVKAVTIASLVEETVIQQGMRPRAVDVRIPDRPSLLA